MKPILFNTEMVRAILDGRKTVTRRVVKVHNQHNSFSGPEYLDCVYAILPKGSSREYEFVKAPYQTGDILYVRETWAWISDWVNVDPDVGIFDGYIYKADWGGIEHPTWHPSIHMPKEAARIFLRVTDVRVVRLQDITISDLQDEGVLPNGYVSQYAVMTTDCFDTFKELWDSPIKPKDREIYGWEANPWVWVIEFEKISKEE